jgi:hypothetical protein
MPEDIKKKLEELDNALIEGKINQETYDRLREQYSSLNNANFNTNPDLNVNITEKNKNSKGNFWVITSWICAFLMWPITVGIWIFSKNKRVKKHAKWSLATVLILFVVSGFFLSNNLDTSSNSDLSGTSPITGAIVSTTPASDKIYTNISWNELISCFKSTSHCTDLYRSNLVNENENKWINGTGRVYEVSNDILNNYYISLGDATNQYNSIAQLYFKDNWKNELSSLQKLDKISFSCKIDSYSDIFLYLIMEDCELIQEE